MSTTRPGPTVPASGDGWTVAVDMPRFEKGRKRGQPVGWLNLNTMKKLHWREQGEIHRLWRKAAYNALSAKRLPKGLGRASVVIELRCVETRDRDVPNYEPTFKPIKDAMQPMRRYLAKDKKGKDKLVIELGVGLIPGDHKKYLDLPEAFEGSPLGRNHKSKGQVILHITPLQEEAVA